MKIKILKQNNKNIKTAILFEDSGRELQLFSDYDFELTCAILKCFIDSKYDKVMTIETE